MTTSLLVISDREPLAWTLQTSSFALPAGRAAAAPRRGDTLLLYTTRGCYWNPGRDRGLVMGVAYVVADPAPLDEPVRFGERTFAIGLSLAIDGVCPVHEGVDLAALRGQLDLLSGDGPWSYRLRRAVVPVTDSDAALLQARLAPLLRPVHDVVQGYVTAARLHTGADKARSAPRATNTGKEHV